MNIALLQETSTQTSTQITGALADLLRDWGVAEGNILLYQSIIGVFIFILGLALAELMFQDTFLVILVAVIVLAVECVLGIFPIWIALLAGIVMVMYILIRGI